MNEALTALYGLQQIDSALAMATRKMNLLDQGKAEAAAAEAARASYEEISHRFHSTSGSLTDTELEIQSVEKKRKDFESKLYGGKVQNPKELQAMQEEIEALGRQRGKLDEKMLSLMEDVETHRKEEADSKLALEQAEASLAAKEKAFKSAARVLTKEIKQLTAQRVEAAQPIPPALLKKYDAFRAAKNGVGIGKIDDGRCGACHTNLPSNLVRSVENTDRIELCENCGRILCVLP
jgi:uncharacterized protein